MDCFIYWTNNNVGFLTFIYCFLTFIMVIFMILSLKSTNKTFKENYRPMIKVEHSSENFPIDNKYIPGRKIAFSNFGNRNAKKIFIKIDERIKKIQFDLTKHLNYKNNKDLIYQSDSIIKNNYIKSLNPKQTYYCYIETDNDIFKEVIKEPLIIELFYFSPDGYKYYDEISLDFNQNTLDCTQQMNVKI